MNTENLTKRLAQQVMLDGCRFRIKYHSNNFRIALRKALPPLRFDPKAIDSIKDIACQQFEISEICAQAYLDLYAEYERLVMAFRKVEEQCTKLPYLPVNELQKECKDLYWIVRSVANEAHKFLIPNEGDI